MPTVGWSTGKIRRYGDAPTMEEMRNTAIGPDVGRAAGAIAEQNPELSSLFDTMKKAGRKKMGVGMIEPGNIDLSKRQPVATEGKEVATVKSISIEQDGKHYLIPTIVEGKEVGTLEAVEYFKKSGEHLGIFETGQYADAYSQELSKQQGKKF